MPRIKVGVIGVGNCFAGLVQGIEYYKRNKTQKIGLMHEKIGGYGIEDIDFVSAFDVGENKIGKPLSEAIYMQPNMVNWVDSVSTCHGIVKESPILDGVGVYVASMIKPIRQTKSIKEIEKEAIEEIESTGTRILINYLPVGSQKATEFWANVALKTNCSFINCIPVFIASDKKWGKKFAEKKLPVIGDDVKGQIGATIVHRILSKMCVDRGTVIDKTYQINVGGNSVTGDQEIILIVDGEVKNVKIGDFVDSLMERHKIARADGKEIVTSKDLPQKIECLTVDENYNIKIVNVDAFIRHEISEPIYEIETEEGRKIKITGDHNLFILDDNGELKNIPVKELKEKESFVAVPDSEKFAEKVGFIQSEKNDKLFEILKNKPKTKTTRRIPNLRSLRYKWRVKSTTWYRNPTIEATVVLSQLDKIKDEKFREKIRQVCEGDVKFLKVRRIQKIPSNKKTMVYDISTKPYERFICSNFLVHNTDFANMLERERLESKKISKTEAVQSQLSQKLDNGNIYIGPSDFIPFLGNRKLAFIRIEGRMFADIPFNMELRLDVDDKANSGGIVIDAIRCAQLALDKGIGGPLVEASAYLMKHPPLQMSDEEAKKRLDEWIKNLSQ